MSKVVKNKLTDTQILQHLNRLIARQKNDNNLFFEPKHITESILQTALKELYCVADGDIYFKEFNK